MVICGLNNLPTIVLGPEGKNIHSANEWVSQKSLEQIIPTYREIIQHLEL